MTVLANSDGIPYWSQARTTCTWSLLRGHWTYTSRTLKCSHWAYVSTHSGPVTVLMASIPSERRFVRLLNYEYPINIGWLMKQTDIKTRQWPWVSSPFTGPIMTEQESRISGRFSVSSGPDNGVNRRWLGMHYMSLEVRYYDERC